MSAPSSWRARRLLSVSVASAAVLVSVGVSAPGASAAADDTGVATIGELQTAMSTCAGTAGDPTRVTLTADISAPSDVVTVGCSAVLDLAGYDLALSSVTINDGQALTVEDTGAGGTLTAETADYNRPGIRTTGATLTINGGTITATGGDSGAGIGGGYDGSGGTFTITGGTVTATGGSGGAGIGGGYGASGGTTAISGGTVNATAGFSAAGIGGGDRGSHAGITTISDGTVVARGGAGGAGIGCGAYCSGGTASVSGGTVTATGGIRAAGIGGGYGASGGETTISGGVVTAVGGTDGSAVGPGQTASTFGSLVVDGGVLRLPTGLLRVPDDAGVEISVGVDGVIDGSAGPSPTYADIVGAGQINNSGRILLPTSAVTGGGVKVFQTHYRVAFDTQGGSSAPAAVTVFADTFDHGNRTFPADPTRPGFIFTGWNTQADGSGTPLSATSPLPGSSPDGTPVAITAHAQWFETAHVTSISPDSGPLAGGTTVVITGTGFTGATQVFFGTGNPATSYVVDSNTQITAVAPASAAKATRHVLVRTPGGTSPATPADRYSWTAPRPAVTSISPDTGPLAGGTMVVITGTGFTGTTEVFFGKDNPAASYVVDSNTQITAVAPASTTKATRHILIRTPLGTSPATPADRYTWTAQPPAVTVIDPSSGPLAGGNEVVITGTGFTGATQVFFGKDNPATSYVVDSNTQITAIAPPSTTKATRHILIRTPRGASPATPADRYTWTPTPHP